MKQDNAYINAYAKTYALILAVSILCLILSITISVEKKQYEMNQGGICSAITGSDGCETVQTSKYSSIAGVDNPIYGIIGFSMMILFSAWLIYKKSKILEYLVIAGSFIAGIVAAWFLYLQAFVIHKYCIFCVIIDISSLIIAGIIIYTLFVHKKDARERR